VPRLERLAAAVGMSRYHFHRVFTALTGSYDLEGSCCQRRKGGR
jgi:hypothetical protein